MWPASEGRGCWMSNDPDNESEDIVSYLRAVKRRGINDFYDCPDKFRKELEVACTAFEEADTNRSVSRSPNSSPRK